MKQLFAWGSACLSIALLTISPVSWAENNSEWTLQSTVARLQEVSPELRAAKARAQSHQSQAKQAGSWDNPTVEIEGNDAMGIDDGKGGYDVTRFAITQPLGLSQRKSRRDVADQELQSSQEALRYQQLQSQHQAATAFYDLQFAESRFQLADERLRLADEALNPKKDGLVRYLAPAEKIRLGILREEVQQDYLNAKREYENAMANFQSLLNLPPENTVSLTPMEEISDAAAVKIPDDALSQHPALRASQYERDAAQKRIALAKADRFNAPELTLYQERDVLAGERENITGVGISMQIPVWNAGGSSVQAAHADYERSDAEHLALQRDMQINLRQQRQKLIQLTESEKRFHSGLLEPAKKLLDMTRRSFAVGDADVLALVDAHASYFEARNHHLQLLHDVGMAHADLALAAGMPLISSELQP
jgi:cobalt-zinc-cadmium efflux system outer membrane protein